MKRIFALIGVALLLAMYIATFVFALMKSPAADGLFKAAIVCTLTVPVMLYGYQFVYKYLKDRNNPVLPSDDDNVDKPEQDN